MYESPYQKEETEDLIKQVNDLEAELAKCAATLPGAYYMDPPDGGDVPVSEQIRRMAKDAETVIERLRTLLADIKAWDVDRYMTLPHNLRARIQQEIGDGKKQGAADRD